MLFTADNRPKKRNRKHFIGKNIKIVKHFEPRFIYHNSGIIDQRELPEINNDFDVHSKLKSCKTKRNTAFSRILSNNSNQTDDKISILPNKKLIQTKFCPISSQNQEFKSKSYVEKRSAICRENDERLKSKSFVHVGSKFCSKFPTFDHNSSNPYNRTINPKQPDFEDAPLDKIKKEILINRIEGFRTFQTCSERKQKIEHLRKEIGLLLKAQDAKKQNECENVDMENLQFSKALNNLLVYNLNEINNGEQNCMDFKTRTNPEATSKHIKRSRNEKRDGVTSKIVF